MSLPLIVNHQYLATYIVVRHLAHLTTNIGRILSSHGYKQMVLIVGPNAPWFRHANQVTMAADRTYV